MKRFLSLLVLAVTCAPLVAQSIDVNQSIASDLIAGTWQDDLAQSFKPIAANCAGAGFYMWPGIGGLDDIEVKLYDALPNAGGVILASGNAMGNAGAWVEIFWPPVAVTPGTTYYLVLGANNGSMALAGSINNPYPDGNVFANPVYQAWPQFDYAFHTWTQNPTLAINGVCPNVTIDVAHGTPFGQVALLSSPTIGSFIIPSGFPCAGTMLNLSNPTLRMVRALDANGVLVLPFQVPAGACGRLYVQALDLSSCTPSNLAAL
jgi:hypothetical protein